VAEPPVNKVPAAGPAEVLVVVDLHCQLLAPVELAVAFAAASSATLRGVLVDDANLQRVAGLPFACEVTLLGAQPRVLALKQLSRATDNFSQRFQHLLSERAEPLSLDCSFVTVGDRQQALAMGQSDSAGLLIMGQSGSARLPASRPLRILLLPDDSNQVLPALTVLLGLQSERTVEILVVDAEISGELESLRQGFPQLHLRAVATEGLRGLPGASGLRSLDYVVASRQAPAALLAQVMQWASCPILLVG
jgi:hypothetical protein